MPWPWPPEGAPAGAAAGIFCLCWMQSLLPLRFQNVLQRRAHAHADSMQSAYSRPSTQKSSRLARSRNFDSTPLPRRRSRSQREAQIRPAEGEPVDRRVRRLACGEETVADRRVTLRQTPPRRQRPFRRLAQTIGGSPVRRQPGQRGGMARPQRQNGLRHRQQLLQVKRAGPAAPDQRCRLRLAQLHPLAELPGQDAAARDRQVAPCGRLGEPMKGSKRLFHAGSIAERGVRRPSTTSSMPAD